MFANILKMGLDKVSEADVGNVGSASGSSFLNDPIVQNVAIGVGATVLAAGAGYGIYRGVKAYQERDTTPKAAPVAAPAAAPAAAAA